MVSVPKFTLIVSLPKPPVILSSPEPPVIVSSPKPPIILSEIAEPVILSAPSEPVTVSPVVAEIVILKPSFCPVKLTFKLVPLILIFSTLIIDASVEFTNAVVIDNVSFPSPPSIVSRVVTSVSWLVMIITSLPESAEILSAILSQIDFKQTH